MKTITLTNKEIEYILQGLLVVENKSEQLADSDLAATRCAQICNLRDKINETDYDEKF